MGQSVTGGCDHRGMTRRLLFALAAMLCLTGAARIAEAGRVEIVLDASENMRGTFDNGVRGRVAIDVLSAILKRDNGQNEFGLIAYGLQNDQSCNNAVEISGLAPGKPRRMIPLLQKLKIKGAAPIAKAIEMAARGLGLDKQKPGGIVVIAGGKENCQADPCPLARLIADASDIKINVVAIEDDPAHPNRSLRCLTSRTGGKFFVAANTRELGQMLSAAISDATTAGTPGEDATADAAGETNDATGSTGEIVVQKSAAGTFETSVAEVAAETPDGAVPSTALGSPKASIALRALVADAGPQINAGVVWRVFLSPANTKDLPLLVATIKDPAPTVRLPAGEFLINAAFGRAYVTQRVRLAEGDAPVAQFILNAGALRLSAKLADGTALPAGAVHFSLYSDEQDQLGNRALIASKVPPGVAVRLNAGIYHLVSTYGDANAVVQSDVSVEPGKLTEAVVEHQYARVTLKLVDQLGSGALADTRWTILSESGVLVKESAGALPTHILAPGKYLVVAERGGEKYTQKIAIAAGETRQIEVTAKVQAE